MQGWCDVLYYYVVDEVVEYEYGQVIEEGGWGVIVDQVEQDGGDGEYDSDVSW